MKNKIYEGGYLPINTQAAMAISPQGTDEIEVPQRLWRPHWPNPPKARRVPDDPNLRPCLGAQFGRMRITGLSYIRNKKKQLRWIARCVCGTYELRSTKEVKTAKEDDCCCRCAYTKELQTRSSSGSGCTQLDTGPWRSRPAVRAKAETASMIGNITGQTFGQLTVIGLSSQRKGRWVVQCTCGFYDMRARKALVGATEQKQLRCARCNRS